MAKPHNQSPPGSMTRPVRTSTQWPPPNPGGRPRTAGFRRVIKALVGPEGEEIIATAVAIMRGAPITLRMPDGTFREVDCEGEVPSKDGPITCGPSAHDRLEAAKFLADRLMGKATQSVELSGPEGGPIPVAAVANEAAQLANLTDEELLQVEQARAVLDAAAPPQLPAHEDVLEGELVEPVTEEGTP